MESSSNNKEKEDEMYDAMMTKLLEIVLNPLNDVLTQPPPPPLSVPNEKGTSQWVLVKPGIRSQEKMNFVPANNENYIHNILKWKIFTKKSRKKVLVEAMYL